jgi:nucleotide-binding universal stress UspA family protein
MYETIMWATDGSEGGDLALEEAMRLAGLNDGRIIAVHCDQRLNARAMAWPALPDEDDRRVKIGRQVAALRDHGIDIDIDMRKSHREAADVVAAAAAAPGADVIVCGTRGLGALSGAFLGSFTSRLLHIAPCPVLGVGPRSALHAVTEPTAGATV